MKKKRSGEELINSMKLKLFELYADENVRKIWKDLSELLDNFYFVPKDNIKKLVKKPRTMVRELEGEPFWEEMFSLDISETFCCTSLPTDEMKEELKTKFIDYVVGKIQEVEE